MMRQNFLCLWRKNHSKKTSCRVACLAIHTVLMSLVLDLWWEILRIKSVKVSLNFLWLVEDVSYLSSWLCLIIVITGILNELEKQSCCSSGFMNGHSLMRDSFKIWLEFLRMLIILEYNSGKQQFFWPQNVRTINTVYLAFLVMYGCHFQI